MIDVDSIGEFWVGVMFGFVLGTALLFVVTIILEDTSTTTCECVCEENFVCYDYISDTHIIFERTHTGNLNVILEGGKG